MTVDDQRHLDELRTKLRRICGHKTLSAKQEQAADKLVSEILGIEVAIEGTGWMSELFGKEFSREQTRD